MYNTVPSSGYGQTTGIQYLGEAEEFYLQVPNDKVKNQFAIKFSTSFSSSLTYETQYTTIENPSEDDWQAFNGSNLTFSSLNQSWSVDWDLSSIPPTTTAKVRVRAFDGEAHSDWSVSDTFVIRDQIDLISSSDSINITEDSQQTVNLKLSADPLQEFKVLIKTSGNNSLHTGGIELIFDSNNWNVDQTLTLYAANDENTADDTGENNLNWRIRLYRRGICPSY